MKYILDIQNQIVEHDVISKFLACKRLKPHSIRAYRKSLIDMFDYFNMQLETGQTPNTETLISYIDCMGSKGLKPTTINRSIGVMKSFFSWVSNENVVPNIAKDIRINKVPKSIKRSFDAEIYLTYLKNMDTSTLSGMRNYLLLKMMIVTPLRECEIASIDVQDIQYDGTDVIIYFQGKGEQSKLSYTFANELYNDLNTYQSRYGVYDGPLFYSQSPFNKGERFTAQAVYKITTDALKKSGLKTSKVTTHSIRRTHAVLARKLGHDIHDISKSLGHASASTTEIYLSDYDRSQNATEITVGNYINKKLEVG